LATLIERSFKSCQLLAVSQTFDQCSVSCLHVSSRYVVVQMAGDGFTWTSNARTNLRTNKESWPNMLPDRRACARRSMARLAKMPLLQLPNCQRALAAEAARSVTSYRAIHRTTTEVALPMDRGRQGSTSFLDTRCLTSLWPLAVACPPMSGP